MEQPKALRIARYGAKPVNSSCLTCHPVDAPCNSNDRCTNRIVQVECLYCRSNDECQNKAIRLHSFPNTKIVKCGLLGYGLITTEPVQRFQKVVIYMGEWIPFPEYRRRRFAADAAKEQIYFHEDFKDELYIDARETGNNARFVNHSCIPNCRYETWYVDSIPYCVLCAIEDIPAGSLLTARYIDPTWNLPTGCLCGHCGGKFLHKKDHIHLQTPHLHVLGYFPF